jgi:HlyD family secretion protein
VKVGIANWEFTEIVEGLAEGERIVISLEREGVKVGARATADEKSK